MAGFGYCSGATLASLAELLERLEDEFGRVDALAAVVDKAELVRDLGRERGLPVVIVGNEWLAGVETLTRSAYSERARNTGSVAEAVALLAASSLYHQGRGEVTADLQDVRLLGPRQISGDGRATGATAEGVHP